MAPLKERAKTLLELVQGAEFLYTDGIRDLDEAAAKLLTPEARAALAAALPALEATTGPAPLWRRLPGACRGEQTQTGPGGAALAGGADGKSHLAPLFEMLALLGRDESLTRLRAYTS